jgi:DNA/RNA endonuclease YhcR with UshA esterase domain
MNQMHKTLWRVGFSVGTAVLIFLALFAVLNASVLAAPDSSSPQAPLANDIRISQVYGGGGGASGYYASDYVELFNASSNLVTLDDWSLQYGSATGNFASSATNLYAFPAGTTIAAGQYLLVQLGAVGTGGLALPVTPDLVTTNLNMSQASGKVALANIATTLGCGATATPCTLPDVRIVDLAAFGVSNNAEGGVSINNGVALTNQQGGVRKLAGCQDTDVNNDDFDVLSGAALQPRNTSSPTHSCVTAPDLSVSKGVEPATAVPHLSPVTYTILLENSGAVSDTAVLFTDTLPISATFSAWIEQPSGANETAGVITWAGTVTNGETITFTFTADQTADYGDTITNTAEFSGTTETGTAQATFTVESLEGDVTFVYHDLEDVVQPGETIFLAGDFNGWNTTALSMTADAANDVFTATVPALNAGDYGYKYIVYTDTIASGPAYYDWLNTANRSLTVSGDATLDEYRNVVVGWANLQWPPTLETDMGVATGNVYGKLYIQGVTNTPDSVGRGLKAQVGYGGAVTPTTWAWSPMSFQGDDGPNNDEFVGVMTPTVVGVYSYTTRFDGNWGTGNPNAAWTYGDLNGIPFELSQTGVLTVNFAAVPIATARAGTNGQVFAVEGVVTYVPGTFNAAGWALQDTSGGIGVFDSALVPTIDFGDTVQVIGVRGAFSGEEQLGSLSFFNNLGPGPEVTPIVTSTASIAAGNGEGWIVEIQGTISSLPACTGNYQFLVNDGSGAVTVFVDADTGVNVCNMGAANGEEIRVVGFATQFNTLNEVKPRRPSDVQVLLDAPIVINTTPDNNATGVLTDTLITIQFNEPVTVTADWFDINCSVSGNVGGGFIPTGPASSYTITPAANFVNSDLCNVTVLADQVTGGTGQPMAANYNFSFLVGTLPFGVCSDPAIPVHFVQGDGLVSPLVGTSVVVEGVVDRRPPDDVERLLPARGKRRVRRQRNDLRRHLHLRPGRHARRERRRRGSPARDGRGVWRHDPVGNHHQLQRLRHRYGDADHRYPAPGRSQRLGVVRRYAHRHRR